MADLSSDDLRKSKNNRGLGKQGYRNRKPTTRSKNYRTESDKRYDSISNSRKNTPYKDIKSDYDPKEDERALHSPKPVENRWVSYKSEERNRRTSPHNYSRHEVRNDSRNYNDRNYSKIANNESCLLNTAHEHQGINDERFVSYNNRNPAVSQEDEVVASLWQKIDYLSNQVDLLTQENEKLKCSSSTVQNISENLGAEVNISFRNKSLEERFLPTLEELVSSLLSEHISIEDIEQFLAFKNNSLQDTEIWENVPDDNLFALDNTTVEPDESVHVPKYEYSFCEILQTEDEVKQETNNKKIKFAWNRKTCFNCSGDHVLSKCPNKIDQQKVNANSKQHAKRMRDRPAFHSSVRYHVHGLKESDFKPGVISDELRAALNLSPHQIPMHIYHMRILNYPPGWLQEAAVESSGLMLYDGLDTSTELAENFGNKELNGPGSRVQYDPDKLVDFPGFNVPLPPNFIDEAYDLGLPSLQEYQLRSFVEQNMSKPVDLLPTRKRKPTFTNSSPVKVHRFEEDMDVDEDLDEGYLEFNPPLPEEVPPPPPPDDPPELPLEDNKIPSPPSDSDSQSGTNTPMSDSIMETLAPVMERYQLKKDTDDSSVALPSMKELKELKKRLVAELKMASECSSPAPDSFPTSPSVEEIDYSNNPNSCSPGEGYRNAENSHDLSNLTDNRLYSGEAEPMPSSSKMVFQRTGSKSKMVSLGTPSLSRHSSFRKLPSYNNFSKDVASHINFENLPNSTGTYEKMKKVIKKVKEKINTFMQ